MKKTSIGGQALIEGIMMKGPDKTAMAVRTPDKTIDIEFIKEKHIKDRFPIFGLPVIRGMVNLVESMLQGYKALMSSADKSGMTDFEEEEKRKKEPETAEESRNISDEAEAVQTSVVQPKKKKSKKESAIIGAVMVIATVLGVVLALFLFLYVPALIFDGLKFLTGGVLSDKIRPLFEGVIKIAVFVGYLAAVSYMKDIRRVFMYHGAEHKTIFCYEKGLELNVENVRKQKRFHPRCGTSFMILMLIVSILLSFVIVTVFPSITKHRILWVVIKLLMVPFTCGLGYELIRICGRYDNIFTRAVSAPGRWVQRLTTKEPEDDMIEVAIASLKAVIPEDPEKDRW